VAYSAGIWSGLALECFARIRARHFFRGWPHFLVAGDPALAQRRSRAPLDHSFISFFRHAALRRPFRPSRLLRSCRVPGLSRCPAGLRHFSVPAVGITLQILSPQRQHPTSHARENAFRGPEQPLDGSKMEASQAFRNPNRSTPDARQAVAPAPSDTCAPLL
jgi:hypothetical protein